MYKTKLTQNTKHDYFTEENILKYPERLIIVGFIAADGCIRIQKTGQKLLVFNISIKDINTLNIINNEICDGIRNISFLKSTNSVMLTIPSDQICNDLEKYNIIPKKTDTYILPELSKENMLYFIKGYFYGDGCISYNIKTNKYICVIVGTSNFCNKLKQFFIDNKIVNNCKIYKIKNSKVCFQLHITGINCNSFTKNIFFNNKFILIPRKNIITNNSLINTTWTKYEIDLVIEYGKNKQIKEFCDITNRPYKSACNKYSVLKNNNWKIPYRGKIKNDHA